MNADEAAKRVAANRAAMQELTKSNEGSIRHLLETRVRSRERMHIDFRRIDPDSSHTRDASALLETAKNELARYNEILTDKAGLEVVGESHGSGAEATEEH